eukprot:GEMP01084370.1.p2 GENE.GEMP01084370.1~~GEMP01084370.1.p2  ORF type:complete len:100 (-),score=2.71 GEMP01084370.1:104-403(-)
MCKTEGETFFFANTPPLYMSKPRDKLSSSPTPCAIRGGIKRNTRIGFFKSVKKVGGRQAEYPAGQPTIPRRRAPVDFLGLLHFLDTNDHHKCVNAKGNQ